MPRAFDSDDDPQVLVFTENVDCPGCGEVFEGQFVDYTKSLTVQDMTEPPEGEHTCPECGFVFTSEFTGWMLFNEAG